MHILVVLKCAALMAALEQAGQHADQQQGHTNQTASAASTGNTQTDASRLDKDGNKLGVGSIVQLLAVSGQVAAVGKVASVTSGTALDTTDEEAGLVRSRTFTAGTL